MLKPENWVIFIFDNPAYMYQIEAACSPATAAAQYTSEVFNLE